MHTKHRNEVGVAAPIRVRLSVKVRGEDKLSHAAGKLPAVTATSQAYESIREAIASGVYALGEPLTEERLAELAGVSRTPVREALRRLDAEGLVELIPNRGARVAGWSERDVDEIFGLRVQLEGYSARLAAGRISEEQRAELADICLAMRSEVDGRSPDRLKRITDLNNQFHKGILEAGGNSRLASVVGAVVQRSLVEGTFRLYTAEQLDRSCAHHAEILDALTMRDADWAESVMRAHIFAGRNVARGVHR